MIEIVRGGRRLVEERRLADFEDSILTELAAIVEVPRQCISKLSTFRSSLDWVAFLHECAAAFAPLLALGVTLAHAGPGVPVLPLHRRVVRGFSVGVNEDEQLLIPTLIWLYHSVHGAAAVLSGHCENAIALSNLEMPQFRETESLRKRRQYSGWPPLFNDSCVAGWKFLASMKSKDTWTASELGIEGDLTAAFAAYALLLNLQDLSEWIARAGVEKVFQEIRTEQASVPIHSSLFCAHDTTAIMSATALLLDDPSGTRKAWSRYGIDRADVLKCWPYWGKKCLERFNDFRFGDATLPGSEFLESLAVA